MLLEGSLRHEYLAQVIKEFAPLTDEALASEVVAAVQGAFAQKT